MERNTPYEGPGKLSGSGFETCRGTYALTVKDHFDAAHSLLGFDGPCRYLHGHTWEVEVTVEGATLDEVGILCDFKAVKTLLHAVLENFDHRYINDIEPFDRLNPTAEHLARVIFCELSYYMAKDPTFKNVMPSEVAIWESPQAKVVFRWA